MNLPKSIVPYFRGLLSAPWKFNIVYMSNFTRKSHDFLTRTLRKKIHWRKVLIKLLPRRYLSTGYLVFDETDIDKSYAKVIEGLSWIFSHRFNRFIYGYHIVVIAWTNGRITIPLGWKIYRKNSGKTKIDLALELIKFCLYELGIKPIGFLFDSFYSAGKILGYLDGKGYLFYTQIPKNRLFNGRQLQFHNKNRPYWNKVGCIKGKLRVRIIKNRKKYYLTNNIRVSRNQLLEIYGMRWTIEEMFRFAKQDLGLESCECRKLQSQNNHFGSCFLLYSLLQDIVSNTGLTEYAIKEKATFDVAIVDYVVNKALALTA